MGGIPEQRNGSPVFHDDATDAAHGLKSSPQILPVAPMESSLLVPEQLVDPAVVLPPLPTLPDDPDEHPNWYDIYREHMTLYRAAAELRKAVADAAKSEIELADYRRRDADARAEAARSLVYTFYAGVDEDSVRQAIHTLSAWSRRDPSAPMTIVLNSPGGRVLDGLALFDFLRRLRLAGHFLRVEVFGRAASMGGVLLQAGDERVLGANAFILIHEVHGGMEGTSSQISDQVGFHAQMEKRCWRSCRSARTSPTARSGGAGSARTGGWQRPRRSPWALPTWCCSPARRGLPGRRSGQALPVTPTSPHRQVW